MHNRFFVGVGNTFLPDGSSSCRFEGPLWHAGRFAEIVVRTADDPLEIRRLAFTDTRYQLRIDGAFESHDAGCAAIVDRCLRTLIASCHDGYVDGPCYEQMTWAGDAPQIAALTYAYALDDRTQRKVLRTFDTSRMIGGISQFGGT